MSTSSDSAAATASAATGGGGNSQYFLQNLSNIGLGYAIAFALGFLVLLSTVLLASYICCRSRSRSQNPNPNTEGVIIPRIIFVAEDDEDEENGGDIENSVAGLDQMVINSYPKFPFSKSKNIGANGDLVCSICLCDYKEGEMLRMMPDCRHFFHIFCVDAWLRLHASCPVCRNSPLPTPLSTPLSELVPLSQYGDNRRR
ncbi:hypothetical protein IFM89_019303 [Coptis chinensis]|uniref:RING-type domain-containing protein n=1 Tax=Coptis chinensis TaxID=261450 RepID=A0A835IBN9_9MAGN|nr:hypothetical protein IFM89_019303 [Coptis chinensis]